MPPQGDVDQQPTLPEERLCPGSALGTCSRCAHGRRRQSRPPRQSIFRVCLAWGFGTLHWQCDTKEAAARQACINTSPLGY